MNKQKGIMSVGRRGFVLCLLLSIVVGGALARVAFDATDEGDEGETNEEQTSGAGEAGEGGEEQTPTVNDGYTIITKNGDWDSFDQYLETLKVNKQTVINESAKPDAPYYVTSTPAIVHQGQQIEVSWTGKNLGFMRLSAYADLNGDKDFDDEGECLGVIGKIGQNNSTFFTEANNHLTFTLPNDIPLGETRIRLRFDGAWWARTGKDGHPEQFQDATALVSDSDPYAMKPDEATNRTVYDVRLVVQSRNEIEDINIGGLMFGGYILDDKIVLGDYRGVTEDNNGTIQLTHTATYDGDTYTVDDLQPVFDALKTIDDAITVEVQKGVTSLGERYAGYRPQRSEGYEEPLSTDIRKDMCWDLDPAITTDYDSWNLNVKVRCGTAAFNDWGTFCLAAGTDPTSTAGGFQLYQNVTSNGKGLELITNQGSMALKSHEQPVYLQDSEVTLELKYRREAKTLRIMIYSDKGVSIDQTIEGVEINKNITNLSSCFGVDTQVTGLVYNFINEEAEAESSQTVQTWLNKPNITLRLAADYDGAYRIDEAGSLWGSALMQQLIRVPVASQLGANNRFSVPESMLAISPDAFVNNPTAKVKIDLQRYLMVDDLLKPANVSLQMSTTSTGEESLVRQIQPGTRFAEVMLDRQIAVGEQAIITLPMHLTVEQSNHLFDRISRPVSLTLATTEGESANARVVFEEYDQGMSGGYPYLVTGTVNTQDGITFRNIELISTEIAERELVNGNLTAKMVGVFDQTAVRNAHTVQRVEGEENVYQLVRSNNEQTIPGFGGYVIVTNTNGGEVYNDFDIEVKQFTRYNNIVVKERVNDGAESLGSVSVTTADEDANISNDGGVYTINNVHGSLTLTASTQIADAVCLGWWMTRTVVDNGGNNVSLTTKLTSEATVTVTPVVDDVTYYTRFANKFSYQPEGEKWYIEAVLNDNGENAVTLRGEIIGEGAPTALVLPSTFTSNETNYTITQLDNNFLQNDNRVTSLTIPATVRSVGSRLQYTLATTEGEGADAVAVTAWELNDDIERPALTGEDWTITFKYDMSAEGATLGGTLLSSDAPEDADRYFRIYVEDGVVRLHVRNTDKSEDSEVRLASLSADVIRGELHYTGGRLHLTFITSNGNVYEIENGVPVTTWGTSYGIRKLHTAVDGGAVLQSIGYNFITVPRRYEYSASYQGRGENFAHIIDGSLAEWYSNPENTKHPDAPIINRWLEKYFTAHYGSSTNPNANSVGTIDLVGLNEAEPIDNSTDFTITALIEYNDVAFNPYGSTLICTGQDPAAANYSNGFQVYVTSHGHKDKAHHVMIKVSGNDGTVSTETLTPGQDINFEVRHIANGNTYYTIKQGTKVIYTAVSRDALSTIRWFSTSVVEGTNIKSLTLRASRADQTRLILDANALQEIVVDEGNPLFSSHDGLLYDNGGQLLLRVPNARGGIINAPADLVEVSSRAFENNSAGALLGVSLSKFHMSSNLMPQNTAILLSQENVGDSKMMEMIGGKTVFPKVLIGDRVLTTNKWNTFVLPFDISASKRDEICTRVRQLTAIDVDGGTLATLYFDVVPEGEGLKAGVPYLLEGAGGEMDFNSKVFSPTITPQVVTCERNGVTYTATMLGSFDSKTIMSTDGGSNLYKYFISNNQFHRLKPDNANAYATLKGYRGYVTLTSSSPANVPMMRIGMFEDMDGGMATTVEGVQISSHDVVDVYDLSGHKVREGVSAINPLQGLPKGIYIVNGRKLAN